MEEIEVPIETIQEEMHEHIQHHQKHNGGSSWLPRAALSSAFFAVFAAIASLLAGHHSNEAMIDQIQASDQWGYYQAKGIKSAILSTKVELLQEMGKAPNEKNLEKLESYKKDQEEANEKATEHEHESAHHLRVHQVFGRSVTFFQIAITVAAISVLTQRKKFWFGSIAFGLIGLFLFILGFLTH